MYLLIYRIFTSLFVYVPYVGLLVLLKSMVGSLFVAPESPWIAFRAGVQESCAEQVLPAPVWRLLGPCLELAY